MPNVIFCDSFDHYAIGDITAKGYQTANGSISLVAGQGRNGTTCLRSGTTTLITLVTPSFGNLPTFYVGMAYRTTGNNDNTVLITLTDGGSGQVDLRQTNAGELKVTRNGTQLAVTTGLSMAVNVYYYIEFMATIHPTAGVFQVRLNGNVLSALNLTGQNTRNTSNSYANQVKINGAYSATSDFDDLVIATDAFSGDCSVKALYPQGAGAYSQWSIPTTAYTYPLGSGLRTAITITQGASNPLLSGTLSQIVDGSQATGCGYTGGHSVDSTQYVQFDFGSARVITEVTWYGNSNVVLGNWKWQGSNDGSSFTDITAAFALGQANTQVIPLTGNVTAYRYYRLTGVSGGTGGGNNLQEVEFKIDNGGTSVPAWQVVDEASMNSDVDYVYTGTAGNRNSYDFQAVGVTGNIKAVQHVSALRKDDAGSRTAAQFARIAGNNYDGTAASVLDNYQMQRRILTVNPATSNPWNSAEVDVAEFGSVLVS